MAPLSAPIEGLRPAPPGTTHLVTPEGSGAVVRHFLSRAAVEPQFGQRVTEVSIAALAASTRPAGQNSGVTGTRVRGAGVRTMWLARSVSGYAVVRLDRHGT